MSNGWFLQDLMASIADQGRSLLPNYLFSGDDDPGLQDLAVALMSGRGEATGVAIAQQLLRHYRRLETDAERSAFFRYVAEKFKPDTQAIVKAAHAYEAEPGPVTLSQLQSAVESPLQEFFRRLNLAPGGTAEIVHMREDLLKLPRKNPSHAAILDVVDHDIVHLLQSWFNRGFLVLRRIDWQTPASILEKIIAYEAVHAIDGWDDLRRRLDPVDRRCYAFFHPSLIDEPLIFVEVALMTAIPESISSVLREAPKRSGIQAAPTTAVFYSISNCQAGLRGISFGNFLIKQVVEDLLREHPGLKTFVTLSPVPRFAAWLETLRNTEPSDLGDNESRLVARLHQAGWSADAGYVSELKPVLQGLAARYFLEAKSASGNVIDPVARFHLGNGARLERINMLGDTSKKGLAEAHGIMVNYLYEPREIEKNHEAFLNDGTIAASRAVRTMLKALPGARSGGGGRRTEPA